MLIMGPEVIDVPVIIFVLTVTVYSRCGNRDLIILVLDSMMDIIVSRPATVVVNAMTEDVGTILAIIKLIVKWWGNN